MITPIKLRHPSPHSYHFLKKFATQRISGRQCSNVNFTTRLCMSPPSAPHCMRRSAPPTNISPFPTLPAVFLLALLVRVQLLHSALRFPDLIKADVIWCLGFSAVCCCACASAGAPFLRVIGAPPDRSSSVFIPHPCGFDFHLS